VLAVVAVLLVGSAAVGGFGWWHSRAPYPPAAVAATATIRFTDYDRFTADAAALGVTGLNPLVGGERSQVFIGRIDYRMPAAARGAGSYYVVVIDKRTNTVAPELADAHGGGWDGFLGEVAKKYPWLSAMAPIPAGGGWTFAGSTVSVATDTPAPITFAGIFPARTGMQPSDLLVALIFIGPDQQIYWATPLTAPTRP
jgi:hypothetical protein